MSAEDLRLIGRNAELSRLTELVTPPYPESNVLTLLGDPGMGKTALVSLATSTAKKAAVHVLAASGLESEQDLPFAGLHQLLRPVLARVASLPNRQAQALRGAFALSDDFVEPDAFLTGIAVLSLLSQLSEHDELLVVIDDVQWMDRASLEALAFAIRRLESEHIVLLLSGRGTKPPVGFERDLPEPLLLEPLGVADAGRLLDAQPQAPRGRAREQVLAQASGNPLALIELAKVAAADPSAGRRWADEPLPLSGRLTAVLTDRFTALPERTRTALLIAAVADNPELTTAVPGLTAVALAPAEEAGLVRLDASGTRFTHPLVRAAVYHAVPFAERAAAHQTIAATLIDQPDRHVWHLASATLEADEKIAALLEESAARAQRRGGAAAAARALERAAELTLGEEERARRLLAAANLAAVAGQADWVRDLAQRALSLSSNPDLRVEARLSIGWALLWSARNAEALDMLIDVSGEVVHTAPDIAWDAIALAATAAHQTGSPENCGKVLDSLRALDNATRPSPEHRRQTTNRVDENRVWIKACTNPFGDRAETVPYLQRISLGTLTDPGKVGAAAWVLDETELAVRILRDALAQRRAPGVNGRNGAVLSALQWACIDSGRWDDALDAAYEADEIAAAYKMATVAATADLTIATIAAMRGDHEQVAPLLNRAMATVDATDLRGFAARAHHAAGLDSLAQGNGVTAYAQLRKLFHDDGAPLHHHFSYLSLADLASAAVRAERHLEARALVGRTLRLLGPEPGPRLKQIAGRARGLLAEPEDAEAFFAAALADAAGSSWPFERARLQLDYGEWLRRTRRINDAKLVLRGALDAFGGLHAAPWVRRAATELRACGVAGKAVPSGFALDELTAQQREIVMLAGQGLTNAEIADQLFLSPRTVASHLYRAYPKLNVSGRHQLRSLMSGLDEREPSV
jgi:DNA-binding CsgD family transcriptional regulator/tetratricopeptide (TPR) repeat protein